MIDPGRSSDGIFDQLDLFATFLSLAGASESVPSDRFIDSVDQTSFLLAPDGLSSRKFHYYWLTTNFSGLRVGEYKWMRASISDDDGDVAGAGGFTGVLQQYPYGRLYNLWLDPKETHSYMTRKLAYLELLLQGRARHLSTFREWPSRPRPRRG
jgi:arylsulfatase